MNKIASLTAALWALGTSAYASEASFNEAVNLYLKGYADCREANTLRSDDIKAARKFFDNYLKILDQAAAIDPAILKTTERDMDANLTYCERVNDNLKMAEAAPVLEAGFADCEAAKAAMANNDFTTAQQSLDAYAVKRDEALAITPNIMDVFSLASQVRACGRLEEKLAEARKASEAEAKAVADLEQQLNHYQQKCQNALSYTRKNTFTIDTIDQANRLLADAQQARKRASSNTVARQVLKADETKATTIKQQEDAAGRCEVEVSGLIRNMTKQRELVEQSLETAITSLVAADNQCKKGKQLLTQGASNAREQVTTISKEVMTLIGKGNTPALASIAKRHPTWSQSKEWSQRSTQANQCQQSLQASLANAIRATATANNAKPAPAPATKASTAPAPAETAAKVKTETPPAAEATPTAVVDMPAPAAGPAESNVKVGKGDWTELVDETDEAAPEPVTSKNPLRKSWTDLAQ